MMGRWADGEQGEIICIFPVTNHQSPITSPQSPITNHLHLFLITW
ncbi:hypothetical protein PN497_03310 [Sphaerospermopsis kisseleviana CS-549]|uniref:Uncharacterized protein n=1 Tax=Sphaerospermopsis kisseleviana CS-549 TaxID=3021783 RepID=A0ABT4ZM00_9CYAN|nr:hypothetical protein [Sphaerospermopsis kisseleviana]MDB9440405.1 hypothetical protein [Sphaerospermopsis kisseleviana CS-549]